MDEKEQISVELRESQESCAQLLENSQLLSLQQQRLSVEVASVRTELTEAEKSLDAKETIVTLLQGNIKDKECFINAEQAKVAELTHSLADVTTRLSAELETVRWMNSKCHHYQVMLQLQAELIDRLRNQLVSLSEQIELLEAEKEKLNTTLNVSFDVNDYDIEPKTSQAGISYPRPVMRRPSRSKGESMVIVQRDFIEENKRNVSVLNKALLTLSEREASSSYIKAHVAHHVLHAVAPLIVEKEIPLVTHQQQSQQPTSLSASQHPSVVTSSANSRATTPARRRPSATPSLTTTTTDTPLLSLSHSFDASHTSSSRSTSRLRALIQQATGTQQQATGTQHATSTSSSAAVAALTARSRSRSRSRSNSSLNNTPTTTHRKHMGVSRSVSRSRSVSPASEKKPTRHKDFASSPSIQRTVNSSKSSSSVATTKGVATTGTHSSRRPSPLLRPPRRSASLDDTDTYVSRDTPTTAKTVSSSLVVSQQPSPLSASLRRKMNHIYANKAEVKRTSDGVGLMKRLQQQQQQAAEGSAGGSVGSGGGSGSSSSSGHATPSMNTVALAQIKRKIIRDTHAEFVQSEHQSLGHIDEDSLKNYVARASSGDWKSPVKGRSTMTMTMTATNVSQEEDTRVSVSSSMVSSTVSSSIVSSSALHSKAVSLWPDTEDTAMGVTPSPRATHERVSLLPPLLQPPPTSGGVATRYQRDTDDTDDVDVEAEVDVEVEEEEDDDEEDRAFLLRDVPLTPTRDRMKSFDSQHSVFSRRGSCDFDCVETHTTHMTQTPHQVSSSLSEVWRDSIWAATHLSPSSAAQEEAGTQQVCLHRSDNDNDNDNDDEALYAHWTASDVGTDTPLTISPPRHDNTNNINNMDNNNNIDNNINNNNINNNNINNITKPTTSPIPIIRKQSSK